ncbi:hypothetical protein NE237_030509 [Protea cynaroides]|uniref:Uncharacterized protein n=1 Tax=Protea cynaroides TaxID=273540 RepID=A0A9Q0GT65_9MAGN|nr:hypothetical protein NE237_030509 [Protea cynaroides]
MSCPFHTALKRNNILSCCGRVIEFDDALLCVAMSNFTGLLKFVLVVHFHVFFFLWGKLIGNLLLGGSGDLFSSTSFFCCPVSEFQNFLRRGGSKCFHDRLSLCTSDRRQFVCMLFPSLNFGTFSLLKLFSLLWG